MRHGVGIEDDQTRAVGVFGGDPDRLAVLALRKVGRVVHLHDHRAVALDVRETSTRRIGLRDIIDEAVRGIRVCEEVEVAIKREPSAAEWAHRG